MVWHGTHLRCSFSCGSGSGCSWPEAVAGYRWPWKQQCLAPFACADGNKNNKDKSHCAARHGSENPARFSETAPNFLSRAFNVLKKNVHEQNRNPRTHSHLLQRSMGISRATLRLADFSHNPFTKDTIRTKQTQHPTEAYISITPSLNSLKVSSVLD